MTALEIRIIAYALVALLLVGLGWRITSWHYQALMERDRAAQDVVVANAQDKVIAAQQAQQQARDDGEKKYADLKAQYDGLSARLADSVRAYSALRPLIVPTGSHPAAHPAGAGTGSGSDSELATLSGRAAEACYHDAEELMALQTWARSLH